jgi:ATP-dependent RNA helicase DeaD
MQKLPFSELGLSEPILKAVEKLGFEQTSPIQSAAIPVLMSGRDAVGQSATGSGKTAAFAIPAIERVQDTDRKPQILVLVPTRELATQVAEEFSRLSAFRPKVHAVPIYGGASYDRQFSELRKGPQIVIGTPGRIIDHLQRNTLDLSEVKMAVLDECDRMLDMGFREDMERILSSAPKERQTVFFSATLPPAIKRLIEQFSKQPEHIKIEAQALTVPTVEQIFFDVPPRAKLDALCRLLDIHDARLSLVFANTQRTVDEITDALLARGYSADRLHGGISQALRTRTMGKFKRSEFEILVATDVAGRGLDVDDLDLVINYDLPYDPEDYVHRVGRTGRAGRKGVAMTLVSGREVYRLQHVERFTRQRIRRGRVPTWDQVEEKRLSEVLDKVRAALEDGKHEACGIYIDRLLDDGHAATDLAAALLQQLLAAEGIESTKKDTPDPFAPRVAAGAAPQPAAQPVKPAAASKKAAKAKASLTESVPPSPEVAEAGSPEPEDQPRSEQERTMEAPNGQLMPPIEAEAAADKAVTPVPSAVEVAPPAEEQIVIEAPVHQREEPARVQEAGMESDGKQLPAAVAAGEAESAPVKKKSVRVPVIEPPARARKQEAEPAADEADEEADAPRPKSKPKSFTEELPPPSPGYRWITLSAGKEDGLAPRDVVDAITEGGDVDGKSVGLIKLHDRETHVQVKATVAAAVVEALEGATLGDKELSVHFARAGAPPRSRKAAEERSERPAFRRDEDRERRTDDRPRRDYGGFRKPDRPYEKKPGGFGGRPGGFRKSYGDREERPGGFRKESPGFAKKPGGYFKKPGGFRKEGGSYGAKPSGFRQYGETRSGDTRSWSKEERPSSEGRSYSPRREDDRPYSPRPPRKNFGGPKKGPGRW